MPDPRSAQSGSGGISPRLARAGRDPRTRTNAQAAVGDQALDKATMESASGRTRFSAFDGLAPLAATASLEDVVARVNLMQRKAQGR